METITLPEVIRAIRRALANGAARRTPDELDDDTARIITALADLRHCEHDRE